MLQLKLVCDGCQEELPDDPAFPYRHGDGPKMRHDARAMGWSHIDAQTPEDYCRACTMARLKSKA